MRQFKQVIQDQMDYVLCKFIIDYLYSEKAIGFATHKRAMVKLKKKYDPPTLMMEGEYEKESSED